METEIEIYSDRTCADASTAKALLEYWHLPYEEYFPCAAELGRLEQSYVMHAPLIFVNGLFLGGLVDLQAWLAHEQEYDGY